MLTWSETSRKSQKNLFLDVDLDLHHMNKRLIEDIVISIAIYLAGLFSR